MPNTSQTPVNKGAQSTLHIAKDTYLKQYMDSLPCGILDKRYPGIGATTLEIEDQTRNSIIVCPTRALAATKTIGRSIHYIGSLFQDVSRSSYEEILSDLENGVFPVKIVVVADSLISLYDKLKEQLLRHEFFIVIDEVDSFQTESNYRPKLEECIDIYLEFPTESRCLVSATVQQFSDSRLKKERRKEVVIDNYDPPKIHVINATKSVIKVAAELIKTEALQPEKLFIAFNSIEGILKILKLLPDDLVNKTGILCSVNSTDKIKAYNSAEIKDGLLQHKITFFTSAFFVGLDVLEPEKKVKVIIIVDTDMSVSLLSIAKIRQIIGRVRNGSKGNTLILNCDNKPSQTIGEYNAYLDKQREVYENIINSMYLKFKSVGLQEEADNLGNIMFENCTFQGVRLLRKSKGKVAISSCNIDYLKQRHHAFKTLYTDFHNTVRNLSSYFTIERQDTLHTDLNASERSALAMVTTLLNDELFANRLYLLENQISDPKLAKGKNNKILTTIWQAASPIIDAIKVIKAVNDLPSFDEKYLNKLLFQVRVFSQPDESNLWNYLNMHFKKGNVYSGQEIHRKLNEIAKALDGFPIKYQKSENASVRRFKEIYNTKRKKSIQPRKRDQKVISTRREEFCK